LAGRILLKVEDLGRAVYVNPVDLKLYQLNSPIEAYNILKKFGLGITDINLNKITNGTMLYANFDIKLHTPLENS